MAYRMLTGRYCLSVDMPSDVIGKINSDWDDWINRALAYNPADRFASASKMLQSLPGLEFDEDDDIVGEETKAAS